MTFDPPTMVRCPQCCEDPHVEPDTTCTLCKGRGKVNPAAATFWRAANVTRERTIQGVAPPPNPVPAPKAVPVVAPETEPAKPEPVVKPEPDSEPRVRPKREGGTRAWMVAVLLVAGGAAYVYRGRIESVVARQRSLLVGTRASPSASVAPSATVIETASATPVTSADASSAAIADASVDAGSHAAGRRHQSTGPAHARPATSGTDNPY